MWCWAEGKEEDKRIVSSQQLAEEEAALLPAWCTHWSCSMEVMGCLDQWFHEAGGWQRKRSAPQRKDGRM